MWHVVDVADPDDPRLDDFRDLTRADRRPDRPGGRGLVVAEGVPVVQRLLDSPYPIRAVMGVGPRLEGLAGDLRAAAVPTYRVDATVMARVVGFHLNRGVLATAERIAPAEPETLLRPARRVVVCEGVNDHENLGALFRNAAALGIDAVLLAERCADPLYRRSVRVSMGHVLRVPFAPLPGWPGSARLLRDAGFELLALTPRAGAVPIGTVGVAGRRIALLAGAEGPGLSEAALAAADHRIRIPMRSGVDSLNVATAVAVATYALAPLD